MKQINLGQFYQDLIVYEVAKVIDTGNNFLVKYITESTINWTDELDQMDFIPVHPIAAEAIREAHRAGKNAYINKDWSEFSKEALITSIEINPITNLDGYKKRAAGFIKSFINPIMSSVHASIVYGFTTLNNRFIEKGYVFSEENKTLKYIEIIEKSEEVIEAGEQGKIDPQIAQNLSDDLMNDLEKYIEYNEILSRTNFVWNESEKYIAKIYEVVVEEAEEVGVDAQDDASDKEFEAKQKIDTLVKDFQIKINNLNNLK